MGIKQELASAAPQRETLVTIGVFDGVHAGHRHLLGRLRRRAEEGSLLSAVVTFFPHPQSVLRPDSQLPWLSDIDDRVRSIRSLGIDMVVVATFTPEVARLSARDFLSLLRKHLRMRGLVVGPDFALGRGREGDLDSVRALASEMGFSVEIIAPHTIDGVVVSSTLIRRALAEGDTRRVESLMGRRFQIAGTVIAGDRRGRTLGFPTANLSIRPQQALPGNGIYATITHIGGDRYPSATSIGTRPTFGDGEKTVETYVLDYREDLYDREIAVEFVQKLRDEERFASAEELRRQIERDIRAAEAILAGDLR